MLALYWQYGVVVFFYFISRAIIFSFKTYKTKKRYPESKIAYVTSSPLDTSILEYYLSLVPNVTVHDARERLLVLSTYNNSSSACLSKKILDHPRLLYRLEQFIVEKKKQTTTTPQQEQDTVDDVHGAVLSVLRGTAYEERIARLLKVPMYFARNSMQYWGTKPGSRTCFHELNIPHADGTYIACYNEDDLIEMILPVLRRNPNATKGVVKLSDGFSGKGNAIIYLEDVQKLLQSTTAEKEDYNDLRADDDDVVQNKESTAARQAVADALRRMEYFSDGRDWDEFLKKIKEMGAIFELFLSPTGNGKNTTTTTAATGSPSVQLVINAVGEVVVLSSHEQVLDGQIYIGCSFPAHVAYRRQIQDYGRHVGKFLARKGVVGHFAVDFMCFRNDDEDDSNNSGGNDDTSWDIYAVEINLRITATTHPMMTLRLLTHGELDQHTGLFHPEADANTSKHYMASDNGKCFVALVLVACILVFFLFLSLEFSSFIFCLSSLFSSYFPPFLLFHRL